MKKALSFFVFPISLILLFTSCTPLNGGTVSGAEADITHDITLNADISSMDFDIGDDDQNNAYDAENAVRITFSASGISSSSSTAAVDGNTVTICKAGTYILSGKNGNARLAVNSGKKDKIRLVLDGLDLTSTDGPAVYVKEAGKIIVTTVKGKGNSLSDEKKYSFTDENTTPDAVFFSKADLTFNGEGTLSVNGNYKHGIVSKDDLIITGGTLLVNSTSTGIEGKDSVKISGGTITVNSGTDGIRTAKIDDPAKGYIFIGGGEINITSGNDGIQAATVLNVIDGSVSLITGGGSANSSTSGGKNTPGRGMGGPEKPSGSTSDTPSAKGIKAASDVIISGGTLSIDSSDDSVHSNTTVTVSGGTLTISSGDDGIHADSGLCVSEGTITITKSYEGLESADIVISGGRISINASDDGINAAGGKDSSAVDGRPGKGGFARSTGNVTISGGYTVVNASGDGIDSNGTVTVSGGITLVSGPTNNANAAFDYESSAEVSGGILVALGSSGMAAGFTSAENQGAMLVNFTSVQKAGSFAVCDKDGKVIASFNCPKQYSSAVITAPDIRSGNTYNLVSGGTVSDADQNGFSEGGSITGGTSVASVSMTSDLYNNGRGNNPGNPGGIPPGGHGVVPPGGRR